MQTFWNLEASRGGVKIFDETPKRHILGWFHAFWAIDRANPSRVFAPGVCTIKGHYKKSQRGFTYSRGIPHPTKFNQNWRTGRNRRLNQSHQLW